MFDAIICHPVMHVREEPKKILFGLLGSLLLLAVFSGEADAFVLHKAGKYYERWPVGDFPVAYTINPDGFPSGSVDAITNAFQTWDNVASATVSFTYAGTTSVSTTGNDGMNVVMMVTSSSAWTHSPSVAAWTSTWINASNGEILGTDTEFNGTPEFTQTYPWSAAGEPDGTMDIQNIATHEAGHVLGIQVTDVDTEATMYRYADLNETKKRDLDQDDIDAVSFLYPVNSVNLEIVSGNGQTGPPGTPLPEDLQVRVTDTGGNPLQGEFVLFDITQGSGTLADTAPIKTDANGVARTTFTPSATNKTVVRAVAAGLQTVSFWVNNHAPVLSWTGETNYEADGLNPETGYGSTNFVFRIKYTDADNDPPAVARLWVDVDGDNVFEANEKFAMSLASVPPYTNGVTYQKFVTIPFSAGSSNCKYYFEFSDSVSPAGGITEAISPATAINAPDVLQTLGVGLSATSWAIGMVQPGTIQQSPRFEVTNNGDGPETFALWISQDAAGWAAGTSSGPETYLLQGLFCGISETPGAAVFAADDIILASGAVPATASVFGDASLAANGVAVGPAETRGLWLRLTAPIQTVHHDEQTIQVTVGVQP